MAAVLYTLGSVTIPSLASVYNELALKKHMDTSVHLQVSMRHTFPVPRGPSSIRVPPCSNVAGS